MKNMNCLSYMHSRLFDSIRKKNETHTLFVNVLKTEERTETGEEKKQRRMNQWNSISMVIINEEITCQTFGRICFFIIWTFFFFWHTGFVNSRHKWTQLISVRNRIARKTAAMITRILNKRKQQQEEEDGKSERDKRRNYWDGKSGRHK